MGENLVSVEDAFVERARGKPGMLKGILEDALNAFDEAEYGLCRRHLRTYIVASEKTSEVAGFLNKAETEFLELLDTPDALSQGYLKKIMEYIKMFED